MKIRVSTELRHLIYLVIAAVIWGLTFVAQKAGMETMGPLAYNAMRFGIGAVAITPLLLVQRTLFGKSYKSDNLVGVVLAGILLGTILFAASGLQQIGMTQSNAGSAGFITSLYIIIVPIIGIFFHKKVEKHVWTGAVLAIFGLYLLSETQSLSLAWGDTLVFASSFMWALHIIGVGHFASKGSILLLSIIQFTTSALLNFIATFLFESLSFSMIRATLWPILFAAIGSTAIAFTLQVVGQREVPPSKAAIIMSLEAVFALIGGTLFLNEKLTLVQGVGALIMLLGLIYSQLRSSKAVIQS